MNILGLFSPTGTLPVLHHREAGGTVVTQQPETPGVPSSTMPPEPSANGGTFEERIIYARSPQISLTVSAVYRATELRAKTIGVMPVQYQKKDAEKGNFIVDNRGLGRRINYLLQQEPNPISTAASLWEQVTIKRIMEGNGFVYIERDEFGFPLHLWLVRAGAYNIESGTYSFINYLGEHGYVELVNVPREDVLHFPNTFRYDNGFWGIPTLQYAADTLTMIKTEKAQALETAAKGGRVKGFISEEKPAQGSGTLAFGMFSKDTTTAYEQEINQKVYRQDITALRGLEKFVNISMTNADMQLLEQLNLGMDDVARFWAVPRPLLMLDTNSHYNDYQNATMEFHTRTILPDKTDMEHEIFRKLIGFREYGVRRIHICEKPLLAMDPERQAKVDQLNLQTGAKTVNEIRQEHDMPSVEKGDIVYVATNLAELGSKKLSENGASRAATEEPNPNPDEETK